MKIKDLKEFKELKERKELEKLEDTMIDMWELHPFLSHCDEMAKELEAIIVHDAKQGLKNLNKD
jgi:hypothetical protein